MAIPTSNYGIKTDKAHTLTVESMISSLRVKFPAFVTDFTQNFDSTWTQEDVYGRVDPIATFQNTKRTMSIGLSLPAADQTIAAQNLQNCAKLTQMLYPGYINVYGGKRKTSASLTNAINQVKRDKADSATQSIKIKELSFHKRGRVIARSPLVKVEFANLIKDSVNGGGLLGYFTSVSWNPSIDMGYFVSGSELYPKVINLSLSFNVLHQHDLGVGPDNRVFAKKFPF